MAIKKSALKSAKDAKTSKSIVANIAEVGKKLEPSKTWLKTLNNNPAATASQTRQKRQKQTQTKKLTFHIFGMLAEDEDSNNNTVTDGNDILFKYDRDFFDFFTNYGKPYIMFLPMALTTLDTRRYPLAWYVGYYLARDKRNNFRNENRANIVGSILHEVGLIDENGKTNSSVYSHVIEPFFKGFR